MTTEDRLDSLEDAYKAGVLTLRQLAVLLYDAMTHETYCETDGAGRWWLVCDVRDEVGHHMTRVALPAAEERSA